MRNRRKFFVRVTLLLGVFSLGLATSCTSSKQASKIQELEQRLQASERKVAELENKFNPLTTQVGEMKGILLHLANKVNAQQKPQMVKSKPSSKKKSMSSKKTSTKKKTSNKKTSPKRR